MIRPKAVPPRGVLRAPTPAPGPDYARFWPGEVLEPFVEHFWTTSWDLAEPKTAEVLTHPSVQLILEAGRSGIFGVTRGKFVRHFEGRGRVLGTKFRPGGFHPFLAARLSTITDRVVALDQVFGPTARHLEAQALAPTDPVEAFGVIQRFLAERQPRPDTNIDRVARIAERVATDRDITSVEHLSTLLDLGTRSLQRLFAEYVGISPKWMIQRYRLHEAAERISAEKAIDWSAMALDLGYADQAHFIRDFRRLVGTTPAQYARSLRSV